MADRNLALSEDELVLMVKRARLTLPEKLRAKCCDAVVRLEAAAQRLRMDLKRSDAPASVFRIGK